jgi:hypothetical protein
VLQYADSVLQWYRRRRAQHPNLAPFLVALWVLALTGVVMAALLACLEGNLETVALNLATIAGAAPVIVPPIRLSHPLQATATGTSDARADLSV